MATIKICDICGSRDHLIEINWFTGRSEWNGVERENEYLRKDICSKCLGGLLLYLVRTNVISQSQASNCLVSYMKKQ